MRVLTCFIDGDQGVLVCVGGNKEGRQESTGHDWYDDYVPVADQCGDLSGHDDRKLSQPAVEVRMADLVERHIPKISLLMTIY